MGTRLKVKVYRRPPTPRNEASPERLYGVLTVEVRVESERFFVGSGKPRLKLPELQPEWLENPSMAVMKIVNDMKFGAESFTRYGVAARERPYIPGGTVKGNIRSRIELSAVPKDGEVMACFSVLRPGRSSHRHQKIYSESLKYQRDRCDYTRENRVCPVCDIFGSPGLGSRVFFTDFPCVDKCEGEEFEEQVGPGTMRIEVLGSGAVFRGEVAVSWLRPVELGVILWGMGVHEIGEWGETVLMGRLRYAREDFGLVKYRVADYRRVGGLELDPEQFKAEAVKWIEQAEEEYSLKWIGEAERKMAILSGGGGRVG